MGWRRSAAACRILSMAARLPDFLGLGTQKVEDYVSRRFPGAACARFDRVTLVERDEFSGEFAGEQEAAVGAQRAGGDREITQRYLPLHLAGDRVHGDVIAGGVLHLPAAVDARGLTPSEVSVSRSEVLGR